MSRRHLALPRVWMLTDERQGEAMWGAIERLPRGAGVVVRHYSLPEPERRTLARRLLRRGFVVANARPERIARKLGAHAVYGAAPQLGQLPRLHPVHNRVELVAAERAGAALLLLSPAFPTRSHAGARVLGPVRFGLLARAASQPVIALGGMTPNRFRRLRAFGAQGWAAIDAWTESAARA
jgi:thiamine-phosphate pyrophosphorylase